MFWLCEKWTALLMLMFVKVQFEAKILEIF